MRGTKGLCNQEANMICIEGEQDQHEFYEPHLTLQKYLNNVDEYTEYLPQMWKNITQREKELGHGGMDYLMFKSFFDAIENGEEMPIDVYDAASWMSVTALSAQSIAQGGAVQSVPDFTKGKWCKRERKDIKG